MEGARVLITGCSSGIGLLSAIEFARRGHTVFAGVRDPETAGPLRERASQCDVDLDVLEMDVRDDEAVVRAVESVERKAGGLDIVINNAGLMTRGPLEFYNDSEVRSIFETNVFGPMRVARAALPLMRQAGSGTIVNISSLAGRFSWAFVGVYAASKFALEGFSDALYFEAHPFGVRVVVVEVGTFDTEMRYKMTAPAAYEPEVSPYRDFLHAFDGIPAKPAGDAGLVATLIADVATSASPKRRYLVGEDSELWLGLREQHDDDAFESIVRDRLSFWQ